MCIITLYLFVILFSCSGSTLYGMYGISGYPNEIGAIADDVIRALYPGEEDSSDDGESFVVEAKLLKKLIYEHDYEVPIAKACTHAVVTKLSKEVAGKVLAKKNPVYKAIDMYHKSAKSCIVFNLLSSTLIDYNRG